MMLRKRLWLAAALMISACSAQATPVVFEGGTVTPRPLIVIISPAVTSVVFEGGTITPAPLILIISPTLTSAFFEGGTVTPAPQPTYVPTETPTPVPTPTIVPTPANIAAQVNANTISLADYNAELLRAISADPAAPDVNSPEGKLLAAQLAESVLDALIDQALIEQEAARLGIIITEQQIDEELSLLVVLRGGRDGFDQWLQANRQTEQDARRQVARELIATAMRDRVAEQLPRTAEYVHAYHIVTRTEVEANTVLARLNSGARFTALAQSLSIDDSTRPDGGDLGWFTRDTGAVMWQEVEEAAFRLRPGQVSEVVASPVGFHIVRVVERQTRALTPHDTAVLQQSALMRWLAGLRAKAVIQKSI
jgi:parvulin-like peptidyl-prolyl isomerase